MARCVGQGQHRLHRRRPALAGVDDDRHTDPEPVRPSDVVGELHRQLAVMQEEGGVVAHILLDRHLEAVARAHRRRTPQDLHAAEPHRGLAVVLPPRGPRRHLEHDLRPPRQARRGRLVRLAGHVSRALEHEAVDEHGLVARRAARRRRVRERLEVRRRRVGGAAGMPAGPRAAGPRAGGKSETSKHERRGHVFGGAETGVDV
mmetsp:Transcript_91807/g.256583  ORF Transcript_91807/g.256583 Transcript_91807/m.256583 type:complete len:203 (-) Transcript_91807:54-662(-)